MAQVSADDILRRVAEGEVAACEAIPQLVDRATGQFLPSEGQHIDYKSGLGSDGELAKDILGFANAEGGVLLFGAEDDGRIVGHDPIDSGRTRAALGPYIGTRVTYEIGNCKVCVRGQETGIAFIAVSRSVTAYPILLRKEVELRAGLLRKVKYLAGSLFYREGDQTLVESVTGDIDAKARELRFSGAAPRTRSSFLLSVDKPLLRLYQQINDRFFGRETELAELTAKFDDPRGRGVSIAGLGGVGKTELAINLVSTLFNRNKFRVIYSASAKQTLLGPAGAQQTDPAFTDLRTFLQDLAAWLGLESQLDADTLKVECLAELRKHHRVLLFVDNLETIGDRALFRFLDDELPNNCWLVATGRVHKIRNFLAMTELKQLAPEDGGRLLRHELKRQGLSHFASRSIHELSARAGALYGHPLAIRWFAWCCRRDPAVWDTPQSNLDLKELEAFCVAHTLAGLDEDGQRVVAALAAIDGVTEATSECVQVTSGVRPGAAESALWELECAGLVLATVDPDTGMATYQLAPLSHSPATEVGQRNGWEADSTARLRTFLNRRVPAQVLDPLTQYLLSFPLGRVRELTDQEMRDLQTRIDRALRRVTDNRKHLLVALKGECQRHLSNPVSADDLYRQAADAVLAQPSGRHGLRENVQILVEAATVAKTRGISAPQLKRAVGYLEAIQDTDVAPLRVLGMLAEFHAILGNWRKAEEYCARATEYRSAHQNRFSKAQLSALDDALERARSYLK
jgi:Putative DNA-binding domain